MSPAEKILVSACLLGERVRYNGDHKRVDDDILRRWIDEGRVVAVCPEVAGGLAVPRPASEIERAAGGAKVLDGQARVMTHAAADVTEAFIRGAGIALAVAQAHGIRVAVLKEGSPSCGVNLTSDGTFAGVKIADTGVTTALLRRHGIEVFSEHELERADAALRASVTI
jgi:uncharacterized protein YbbK (DUF523 family)